MIIVFGAINIDMSVTADHFPQNGETVLCPDYQLRRGGKGANQAVAAVRLHDKTALVGVVGDDEMGRYAVGGLRQAGIMTSGIAQSTLPTGCAFIMRDDRGDNRIIVAASANNDATEDQVPDGILTPGNVLLLQMEVPAQETFTLIERASARGVTIILNLAPALPIPDDILQKLDYLIMNEIEAAQMATHMNLKESGDDIARFLSKKAGLVCITTKGAQGAVAALADGRLMSVPALTDGPVVDTTGAGDCFCGTFAAATANHRALPDALRYASVAASLSCAQPGTQSSYPYQRDIEEKLSELEPITTA